jgi:parvulin-like peptidyl-prolyl isomerase
MKHELRMDGGRSRTSFKWLTIARQLLPLLGERAGVRAKFPLIVLALLLAFGFGCAKKAVNENVLARVGSREITVQDFEREAQWWQSSRRPMLERDALLEQMIRRELRLQKAKATGLENDPEVKRKIELILAARVEELELHPTLDHVKAAPEEVQAAYEKDIARYSKPAKMRLALICLKTDPKMNPDQLAEVEKRAGEARLAALALPQGSRGLAGAAAQFSDDQASRYRGGDVGWFDAGRTDYRWPTEVVEAGLSLTRIGEISPVIRAKDGFYIVTRIDLRESVVTPLDQVRAPIERKVLASKRQQAEELFDQNLRTTAPVQTFPQAMARVHYPTSAIARAEDSQPPAFQGTTINSNGKTPVN